VDLDALLDMARELISIPSTADRPDELARALDLMLGVVGPGVTIKRFSAGGKPSALVHRDGADGPFRVILNGHLDVVPADADQFRPRREGTRLYGRGAHDMKVAAVVLTDVFRELAAELPYEIALQLVTDEEVGGRDGTGHQLDSGVAGQFVVIGEQSNLRVVTESKGFLQVRLTAAGIAAHAAYPWLGDNALLRLTGGIHRLLEHYRTPAAEEWVTTVNVARIETGNRTFNLVPSDASAWLDIRFPAEDTALYGRSRDDVIAYLLRLCGPGVDVHIDHFDPPHHADPDSADVRLLQKAAQNQGFSGELLRKHGAADGRFYHARGVDAVIFGPGGAGQHSRDEYVEIDTIEPYRRAVREFLLSLAA
jgi:succinyl-diaminopimelate desuccinylase